MALHLFGIRRRHLPKNLGLLQTQVLGDTAKNRGFAHIGRALRSVEGFNGTKVEEEDAADRNENCAEQSKVEDKFN